VPNPFSYENKRVVVTGCYSGVGAALVEVLAELGVAEVTALDVKEPEGRIDRFIATDLSDPAAIDAALSSIEGPVDAVFSNAGVAANAGLDVLMGVNYLALRTITDGLLPKLAPGGAIAVTASMAGNGWPAHQAEIMELLAIEGWEASLAWLKAHPDLLGEPYGFSKELAQVYTMQAAKRVAGTGARINSVCPGIIQTPLLADFRATMTDALIDWTIGQSRLAQPRQIANVLAFLGSEASSFMNGSNVLVDAGFTAALTTGQIDFAGLAG